jgi:hypothetical protein
VSVSSIVLVRRHVGLRAQGDGLGRLDPLDDALGGTGLDRAARALRVLARPPDNDREGVLQVGTDVVVEAVLGETTREIPRELCDCS